MRFRSSILLLLLASSSGTAWAQSKVTLTVQPSPVEVSPWYQRVQARVILRNDGDDVLTSLKLESFTNDAFQVKVESAAVASLQPLESVVWTAWIENLAQARVPGKVQFEASYEGTKKRGLQRVYASLAIQSQESMEEKPVEVSVEGSFDAITETRPGIGHLLVRNNLDVPVKVGSVTILWPDEASFKKQALVPAFDVGPRSAETRKIVMEAESRVTPGKQVVFFDIRTEWDQNGHRDARTFRVSKEATVGVFFESELLELLGVPSFLLLPGCLFIFSMQLLLTLGVFGVNRHSNVPELPVTSPGFWILAVMFSGLFAWAYAALTGSDYLVRYGARDLRNVWLWSIALGAVTYTLIAWFTSWRRRQLVPNTTDTQVATLEKMGRKKIGILPGRVTFKMNNVDVTAFVIEQIEDGQTMVWVAPAIVATWVSGTADALQHQEKLIELVNQRANPLEIAGAIRDAADRKYTAVDWDRQDSIPNPYHLKVENIAALVAPEPIVKIG